MNDLEQDIKEIETVLAAGGDIDPSTFAKHKELSDFLESTMLEWEEANEAYESLQIENYS